MRSVGHMTISGHFTLFFRFQPHAQASLLIEPGNVLTQLVIVPYAIFLGTTCG